MKIHRTKRVNKMLDLPTGICFIDAIGNYCQVIDGSNIVKIIPGTTTVIECQAVPDTHFPLREISYTEFQQEFRKVQQRNDTLNAAGSHASEKHIAHPGTVIY